MSLDCGDVAMGKEVDVTDHDSNFVQYEAPSITVMGGVHAATQAKYFGNADGFVWIDGTPITNVST
jgi:hypothetical protein